jgi:hypothetical protein
MHPIQDQNRSGSLTINSNMWHASTSAAVLHRLRLHLSHLIGGHRAVYS